MKKLFLVPILALSLLMVSCNGDKDPVNPGNNGQYGDYPYSSLTPEQQKEKLAGEANAVLSKISDFADEEALRLIESLTALPEPDESLIIDFDKGNFWVREFKGEYTWNPGLYAWDFKDAEGKIVLNFPSIEDGTSNDAQIVLTGVGSGKQENIEGDMIELPKELKAVMSKNGKNVATIDIKADSPNTTNIANSANVTATIGKYSISVLANKDGESKVNSTLKFSKGNDVIIDGSFGSTMDWDYVDEYEAYVRSYWDDVKQEWVTEYETIRDTILMVDYQTFTVKISSNLAIEGHVNVKSLNEELDVIYENYEFGHFNPDEYREFNRKKQEEIAAAYNKNITGYLVSRDDKTKIASLKFLAVKTNNSNYDEYDVEGLLVFGDNTEATLDAYFGKGFEDIINAWEDFFERLGIYFNDYDEPSVIIPGT